MRLVVLIPAHNEQGGIQATLDALARCEYPFAARRTVVIADNCTDQTAERARSAGAEVWERVESAKRGKGQALRWAIERLKVDGSAFDGVVVLDADCIASANLLAAINLRLGSGASALQVNYVVGNPHLSPASALRFGAFALMNTVRYLGKQRLGLSCGLAGTGMAFTRDLLDREPWRSTGLAEDGEYHMRLVLAGERVEFVKDAWVSSSMPTTLRGSSAQQARWEHGKLQLIGHWSPRLVSLGLAKRDPVRIHAGLECLVPPQSLITAGSLLSLFAGPLLGLQALGGAVCPHPGGSGHLRAGGPATCARARSGLSRFARGTGADRDQGGALWAAAGGTWTNVLAEDRARGDYGAGREPMSRGSGGRSAGGPVSEPGEAPKVSIKAQDRLPVLSLSGDFTHLHPQGGRYLAPSRRCDHDILDPSRQPRSAARRCRPRCFSEHHRHPPRPLEPTARCPPKAGNQEASGVSVNPRSGIAPRTSRPSGPSVAGLLFRRVGDALE